MNITHDTNMPAEGARGLPIESIYRKHASNIFNCIVSFVKSQKHYGFEMGLISCNIGKRSNNGVLIGEMHHFWYLADYAMWAE